MAERSIPLERKEEEVPMSEILDTILKAVDEGIHVSFRPNYGGQYLTITVEQRGEDGVVRSSMILDTQLSPEDNENKATWTLEYAIEQLKRSINQ